MNVIQIFIESIKTCSNCYRTYDQSTLFVLIFRLSIALSCVYKRYRISWSSSPSGKSWTCRKLSSLWDILYTSRSRDVIVHSAATRIRDSLVSEKYGLQLHRETC